jgi:hypothetical protein
MSKICDRNYTGNAAFTVEVINGVNCCPLCKKPAICHGKPVEQRALFWALSGDTGISSEAIAKHMTGYAPVRMSPPSDSSDRGRCIRLLELIPEWLPRLKEMVQYDTTQKQDGFIVNSSGISAYDNSWSKQIPLIVSEGNFARPSN